MSNIYKETKILGCGGVLSVTSSGWEISYYFPGPDRRYNGSTFVIQSHLISGYIEAFEKNWDEFENTKLALKDSTVEKFGERGMVIRCGGIAQGICLEQSNVFINSKKRLVEVINSFQFALSEAPKIQNNLLANSGLQPLLSATEQQSAFAVFLNNRNLPVIHDNPAVAKELEFAIAKIYSKIDEGSTVLMFKVHFWFGKIAANDFLDEIRRRGLSVYLDQSTFVITWILPEPA
jgi:hypothetical protein